MSNNHEIHWHGATNQKKIADDYCGHAQPALPCTGIAVGEHSFRCLVIALHHMNTKTKGHHRERQDS